MKPKEGPLLPEELQEAEHLWIKESQKSLIDRLKKGGIEKVQPIQRLHCYTSRKVTSKDEEHSLIGVECVSLNIQLCLY